MCEGGIEQNVGNRRNNAVTTSHGVAPYNPPPTPPSSNRITARYFFIFFLRWIDCLRGLLISSPLLPHPYMSYVARFCAISIVKLVEWIPDFRQFFSKTRRKTRLPTRGVDFCFHLAFYRTILWRIFFSFGAFYNCTEKHGCFRNFQLFHIIYRDYSEKIHPQRFFGKLAVRFCSVVTRLWNIGGCTGQGWGIVWGWDEIQGNWILWFEWPP